MGDELNNDENLKCIVLQQTVIKLTLWQLSQRTKHCLIYIQIFLYRESYFLASFVRLYCLATLCKDSEHIARL